jgi:hypothetical protein
LLHWVVALDAPALLVVGSYMGTLSYSLAAAAAITGSRPWGSRVAETGAASKRPPTG